MGYLWYALDCRRRTLAVNNIASASDYPWSRRPRSVARASFLHMAQNMVEFARMADMTPRKIMERVQLVGIQHLDEPLSRGKGVLLLTAHLGNWEFVGAIYVARLGPLAVVARSLKNPLVDDLINRLRASSGMKVIPHRNSSRAIIKALGKGETVAVLLDHSSLRREAVFVDFFGRPAATNYGLALLARKTGVPVVPAYSVRITPRLHRAYVMPEIPVNPSNEEAADIEEITGRFNAAIEEMVAAHPEQWLWVHDRWKRRPLPEEVS